MCSERKQGASMALGEGIGQLPLPRLALRTTGPTGAQRGASETRGPTEEVSPHRFPPPTPLSFLEPRDAAGDLGPQVIGGRGRGSEPRRDSQGG